MKKILLMCAVAVGLSAAPAQAILIDSTSVTLSAGDVGQVFAVQFNGLVDNVGVTGLESVAAFELLTFNATDNFVEFAVALKNTSNSGITSRTSAIGFATDPNVTSGSILVAGLFEKVFVEVGNNKAEFPNFKDIELCVTDGNKCQGGANGGVTTGGPFGITRFRLNFLDLVEGQTITLNSFAVRYQAINGTNFDDESGIGLGTPNDTPPTDLDPTPNSVPEPTSLALLGLGLLGAGFVRRRK